MQSQIPQGKMQYHWGMILEHLVTGKIALLKPRSPTVYKQNLGKLPNNCINILPVEFLYILPTNFDLLFLTTPDFRWWSVVDDEGQVSRIFETFFLNNPKN